MRTKNLLKITLVVLGSVIAIISLWLFFSKPTDEYAYGGQKLTDLQYKDLMTQVANHDGKPPEAEVVDCIEIENAEIFKIKNKDGRHVVIYADTFGNTYTKYNGEIWELSGGGIAEIIYAEWINGQIRVRNIESPNGDGPNYTENVKEMFPKNIANKILHGGIVTALYKTNQDEAEKYYKAKIAENGYLDVNIDSGKVTVVNP